jgi:hypothetical protein
MAENKKSFILYCDQKGLWDKLNNEQAGKLIKHILAYVNDENPKTDDFITELAFEPIKQHLKRDLKQWDETRQSRSDAGKAGAKARWQRMAKDGKRINDMAKMAVNVNVNDNVSVSKDIHTLGSGVKFLLIGKYLTDNKYCLRGVEGIQEYFDLQQTVNDFPKMMGKFLNYRNGTTFENMSHLQAAIRKFVENESPHEYRAVIEGTNKKGLDYNDLRK